MSQYNGNFGGGSGGATPCDTKDDGKSVDGTYQLIANVLDLTSRAPQQGAAPSPCIVTLKAMDVPKGGTAGYINLRAAGGVFIGAGPPVPEFADIPATTDGVLVQAGDKEKVSIQRGLGQLPESQQIDQLIEMTGEGITIDAGMKDVTVQAVHMIKLVCCSPFPYTAIANQDAMSTITMDPFQIELSVLNGKHTITMGSFGITLSAAGGQSTITLDEDGITIQGAQVNIN